MRKSLAGAHLTEDKYPEYTNNSKSKEQENKKPNINGQKKLHREFWSHANGQYTPFKALNIPHDQGNKNENYFNFTPVRKAIIKKTNVTKHWQGTLIPSCSWQQCIQLQPICESLWGFLNKTHNRITIFSSTHDHMS